MKKVDMYFYVCNILSLIEWCYTKHKTNFNISICSEFNFMFLDWYFIIMNIS